MKSLRRKINQVFIRHVNILLFKGAPQMADDTHLYAYIYYACFSVSRPTAVVASPLGVILTTDRASADFQIALNNEIIN